MTDLPIFDPDIQIRFYYRLKSLKEKYFFESLSNTVKNLEIPQIDIQLAQHVDPKCLSKLAEYSLRGEVFFPVPYVIKANPFLVGYYRLLYGISQKKMYSNSLYSKFKRLEEQGKITSKTALEINELCLSLISIGQLLVEGLDSLSLQIVRDLQAMTLGAQLRGGNNTTVGETAVIDTFEYIKDLVDPYIEKINKDEIVIKNNSGREISIKFSNDPDISINEKFTKSEIPLIAIEIKGGRDFSNIHNRIGEAEKSHQKAKNAGFNQFWTIIRIHINYDVLKRESPTTSFFFNLDHIRNPENNEYGEFRTRLSSLLGIRIDGN
jgi:XcyI restriction endonuclease